VLVPDRRRSSRTQTRSPRPLKPSIDKPAIVATKTSARGRSTKRKVKTTVREKPGKDAVLVVDDVVDVTEMLSLFLEHAGYEVTTANSAATALRLARKSNFNLVISDIGMPEMNGYELAESLRALSDYRATPIIAITGYTEYDDRGQSLRAGFNAHLTKPINPSQLLNLIEELLH
jgi:CheY-like chemotaxis protein